MGHVLHGSAHTDQVAAEARRLRAGIEMKAAVIRARSAPRSAVMGHFVVHLRREGRGWSADEVGRRPKPGA